MSDLSPTQLSPFDIELRRHLMNKSRVLKAAAEKYGGVALLGPHGRYGGVLLVGGVEWEFAIRPDEHEQEILALIRPNVRREYVDARLWCYAWDLIARAMIGVRDGHAEHNKRRYEKKKKVAPE